MSASSVSVDHLVLDLPVKQVESRLSCDWLKYFWSDQILPHFHDGLLFPVMVSYSTVVNCRRRSFYSFEEKLPQDHLIIIKEQNHHSSSIKDCPQQLSVLYTKKCFKRVQLVGWITFSQQISANLWNVQENLMIQMVDSNVKLFHGKIVEDFCMAWASSFSRSSLQPLKGVWEILQPFKGTFQLFANSTRKLNVILKWSPTWTTNLYMIKAFEQTSRSLSCVCLHLNLPLSGC